MADKSIARNGRVGGRGIYRPSEEEFVSLARSHRVVTVSRTVSADTETPVTAFLKLARGEHAFLLESAEGGERWGRYSFIGREPQMVMSFREGALELPRGKGSPLEGVNPVSYLCELMAGFGSAWCGEELPFAGGAVGYLAYDLLPYLENIELHARGGLDVPEMMFMLTRCCAAFDHLTGRLILLCNVHVEEGGRDDVLREEYRRAISDLESMARDLGAGPPHRGAAEVYFLSEEADFNDASCNFSRAEYEAAVERAREYIHAGEAFQVVPSQRFTVPLRCSPFSVYRSLRSENPSPYMFFLRFGDLYLIGSSPEPMVRRRGDRVVIRPIAGTRPRGATPDEDRRLEEELLRDEKEQAEHVMLVDLARNDLGRVCAPGSVRVERMMEVERFSHVMHLVSEVSGRLRPGCGNFELLRATFPAGTVSGAPKVRACQIIDELEKDRRGPYAGAVGYISYGGDLDTCIAIRTIVARGGLAHVQAGGGVVADSVPAREYEESRNKARALLRAIRLAEAREGVLV
ncbi:MAG: anthranilate synthase component I [Actinobacteria bacterium]|nr:anthranilate synthase component I [Actinomycetota bacterium]